MGYATMWAYVWDFMTVGVSKGVGELRGMGLSAVSIAAKYHTVEHLLPRAKGKRWFVSRQAACYFPPHRNLYRTTPIKPFMSPFVREKDWFGRICEAAQKKGLAVIAWTVFLHDTFTGIRHPEACMENCFGDRYTSNLCPANPAVREFVKALCQDLSRYPLMAIECESLHYGGVGHFHGHEKIGMTLGEVGRFLLGLCFCPHCQRALRREGERPPSVRRTVIKLLEPILRGGKAPGQTVKELLDAHSELQAFVVAREKVVASLVAEAASVSKVPLSFILMGSEWDSAAKVAALNGHVARFEILAYTADPRRVARQTKEALRQVGDGERLVVGLQTYPPAAPKKETLIANTQAAWGAGARNLSFYHYGIMPPENMGWVAEALKSLGGM